MIIGERLTQLRMRKRMSQGDIERRTGLLRCYISRVENGHTVPSVETLEKMCRALEIPLYQLFWDGDVPQDFKKMIGMQKRTLVVADMPEVEKLRRLLPDISERGRRLLYIVAKAMDRTSSRTQKERKAIIRERIARTGQDRRFKVAVG